ncbi:carboxypeptidase regulatory-like domain-containing protein [Microbacterium sp. PA5]|uniref:carboxypeptidase regulatory-like domain-containing protein n=1 Tax=Microbacterium sp. PA5 TaxID=3416654 RepID=UPI003CECAD88
MNALARAKSTVITVAAVALASLIVSGSAVAASAADTASISGTVRDEGAAPIAGVRAELYAEMSWGWGYVTSTLTNASGGFSFPGLPSDDYTISFAPGEGQNYLPEWWDDKPDRDAAATISLAGGHTRTGLVATLATGASISGTVSTTYLSGGPSAIAAVCAVGRTTDANACDFEVDADGSYTLAGLPADDYTIAFGGEGGCGEYEVGDEWLWSCRRAVYWSQKPSAQSATVLTLADHEQRTGVDQDFDYADGVLIYPRITGTPAVGKTLTAARGSWDAGTTVRFQWRADDVPIDGAASSKLTLTASQLGKRISVSVFGRTRPAETPDSYDTWESTGWTMDDKVAAGTLVAAKPAVSGTVAVGSTLAVKRGTWSRGTSFSYRWYANGVAISKATGSTFTLTKAQAGKKISVKVTGSKKGYASRSVTSSATAKVMTAGKPSISGTVAVGKKLTAKPGAWTKGTTFTYRWYANGKAISKATTSTLSLSSSLRGKKITVKVTGKKSGYATVTKASKTTARVR